MKVLYIGGFELPDKNAAAHRVISNAFLLRELGYEVSFIGISEDIESAPNECFGLTYRPVKYPTIIKKVA